MQTQTAQFQDWISGWSVERPLLIDYAFAGAHAPFRPLGNGLAARDLGLHTASRGAMAARHVRAIGPARQAVWQSTDAGFAFLYVLAGRLDLNDDAGATQSLETGGVAVLPSGASRAWRNWTDDFAAIEITASARDDRPAQAPARKPLFLPQRPDDFVVGAGPRRYFAYRDLGTAQPTGRRIHIHVVKSLEPMPGGTGWHTHTMSQLFVVLTGWADLQVEGKGERRMQAGDAMCLRAGMRHNVPAFSADYTVLEMCVPADYDTTATDAPAA
ncbi:MAG: cupin domain-containing protein [Alphaproteobacteria bacterium]